MRLANIGEYTSCRSADSEPDSDLNRPDYVGESAPIHTPAFVDHQLASTAEQRDKRFVFPPGCCWVGPPEKKKFLDAR